MRCKILFVISPRISRVVAFTAKLVASPTLHATPMPESPSGERSGSVTTYRVVHAPSVAIRAGPWGKKLGIKQCGALVHCDASRDGWVRLQGGLDGEEAWMLIHGAKMGLGTLLQRLGMAERVVSRWQVVASPHVHVRAAPRGRVLAQLACGEVVRADMELAGWVRLQRDFWPEGASEPAEGWVLIDGAALGLGRLLAPRPAPAIAAAAAPPSAMPERYWVVAPAGVSVRERPWGRVLARRPAASLLRCDCEREGWVRLEEDCRADDDDDEGDDDAGAEGGGAAEGWVLADGRELGLPRQLLRRRAGEAAMPEAEAAEAAAAADAVVARRSRRLAAAAARGEDWSLARLLRDAGAADGVAALLEAGGVGDIDSLVAEAAAAELTERLRELGVAKLGQRQKLAAIVKPYIAALREKEKGNALYRESRYEEAAAAYTAAIEAAPCPCTEAALASYNNRAACYQQMREPERGLADVRHVLAYEPDNAKALARRQVFEKATAN